ncbi:unnamed protein product [Pieris macdunnoughi]|uniref:Uncharacterized protein n=1 Tax=Pieris macdunnoughi TaxID=345717 RepID=A0A821M0D9_9NEOP|nr:unnamed protein product [Pieris macdunnoughi]
MSCVGDPYPCLFDNRLFKQEGVRQAAGVRVAGRFGSRGAGCARRAPRTALLGRQSPADSALACVTRAAPCTALVPRLRRAPPRRGERDF